MDYFTIMLPYFFKYDNAEIRFCGEYEFEIVVRDCVMEKVILPKPPILRKEM